MSGATIAMLAMFLLGGLLVAGYLVQGHSRHYLLFLGLVFICLGVALLLPERWRWVTMILAFIAFSLAAVASIRETQHRLRKFHVERQDREAAFAEFQQAVIAKQREREQEASDTTVE